MLCCFGPANTSASAQTAAVYICLCMCSITCDDDYTFDYILTAHFARCCLLGSDMFVDY